MNYLESPHLCEKNCHEGPCSRCELKTKYVCKCGNRSKEIKCNSVTSELTCKKKCNKVSPSRVQLLLYITYKSIIRYYI